MEGGAMPTNHVGWALPTGKRRVKSVAQGIIP